MLNIICFLFKTKNRGVVSGSCPWCSTKGQINALRSYAINFNESITLCTGPLCLFPLVSKPLDNICTILSSQDIQGCKRKKVDLDIVSDGKCQNVDVDDCRASGKSVKKRLIIEEHHKQQKVGNAVNSTDASCVTSEDSGLPTNVQIRNPEHSKQVPPLDVPVQDLMQSQLVSTHQYLFWKNRDNLCWLDSLLVAVVHSRIIRKALISENICLTEKLPCKNLPVTNLCATYKKLCTYIKGKEQQCQDNIVRVPYADLRYVEQELEALRMSVFELLQPKLQCKLGQKETPVFALPLLLKSDDWANSFFQHTGQWEFRCTSCGYDISTSIEKTVTTFTQIMADWHPLKAVHRAQCSNCHNKNQKRKLVLQRISLVLALHFVEGLPRRDLSKYAFDFNGTHYSIKTIIQYNEQREHFITWINQPDGLWLEFDDLKHPCGITHRRFTLPARQFHLVFWEADNKCELPDPFPTNSPTQKMSKVDDSLQDITNSLPDDTCLIEQDISINEIKDTDEAASTWDSSIGSTTLLDTFEGLSHSDIVTLTLVEVQEDTKEYSCPNVQEIVSSPAKPSIEGPVPLLEKSSFCQTPSSVKNQVFAKKCSHSPELVPSVVKALESAVPSEVSKSLPTFHSPQPTVSKLPYLAHQHLSHQSTPLSTPVHATHPKVDLRFNCSETLPSKPAEIFGGYRTKNPPNSVLTGKLPNFSQKLFSAPDGITTVLPDSKPKKSANQNILKSSPSKIILSTDSLRLKLMKRLKAKKKKLAKLNQMLSIDEFESTPRPDSTNNFSPYSVASSTSASDSSAFDDFFAELVSPDMSNSNRSPDSTGLMDLVANSHSAGTSLSNSQGNSVTPPELPVPLLNDQISTDEFFFAKLNPESRKQQSVIDNEEFNALDMFF